MLAGLKGGSGVEHVKRNRKRKRDFGQCIAPLQEKLCKGWYSAGDS